MPIIRSCGNIPAQIEQDSENRNVTVDERAGGDNPIPANPARRPKTRLQTQREAECPSNNNDVQVQRIVEQSLSEFRHEMINMIADGFRDFNLANQRHDRQEEHDQMEQLNTDHIGIEEEDNRNLYSGNGRTERRFRNASNACGEVDRNSERVLNIIRNWRMRFTGDTYEFTVDEFIYRVNTLTDANLRGDFDILCEHAHILFEGKALKWFWRYHRDKGNINWDDLCEALKRQYKDYNTDYDIKDDILRRKQRTNETFDEFYDAVMVMCDRLRTPLTDFELCETMQRNLRPEIRHEILHLDLTRVSQLRRAVRRHEKFVRDMSGSNFTGRQSKKGQVTEIFDDVAQVDKKDDLVVKDTEVCLILRTSRCWNCDKEGHSFIDCEEPRTVFCYGCGAKNVYKPKCKNCELKRGNVLKDVRGKKDGHPNRA